MQLYNSQKYKFIQVKFTVDGDKYSLDWNWLTETNKKTSRSLLQKWSETCLKLIKEGKLGEFILATNRIPDEEFQNSINENKICWNNIPANIKKQLIAHIGSEDSCKIFFENFKLNFINKTLEEYDEYLFNIYARKYSESLSDWCYFKDFVKNQSMLHSDSITYNIIKNIIQYRAPKPLDQNFYVPENYFPPSAEFNSRLIGMITKGNDNCIVITGSPGVGKSTYLSYLKNLLTKNDIPVIRHHYYLSINDKDKHCYI